MSILCRIGLHKWQVVGWHGLVMPWQVQQCARCERGRDVGFTGTVHFTAAEMRARKIEPTGPAQGGGEVEGG